MTAPVIGGLHLANKGRNGPPPAIAEQMRLVPPGGCVTALHHQLADVRWIRQHRPDVFVHVRMYLSNWCDRKPEEWARECVAALDGFWYDPMLGVSPANEQNLHYECGEPDPGQQPRFRTVEHYEQIAAWCAAWAREVKRQRPTRKAVLVWPALAYGHEPPGTRPDSEYAILAPAVALYDVLATHPYMYGDNPRSCPGGADWLYYGGRDFRPKGHRDPRDPGGAAVQFPGMPLMWTETGDYRHNRPEHAAATLANLTGQYLAGRGRVVGATVFIAESGPEHDANVIWRNQPLKDGLMAAGVVTATPRPTRRQSMNERIVREKTVYWLEAVTRLAEHAAEAEGQNKAENREAAKRIADRFTKVAIAERDSFR